MISKIVRSEIALYLLGLIEADYDVSFSWSTLHFHLPLGFGYLYDRPEAWPSRLNLHLSHALVSILLHKFIVIEIGVFFGLFFELLRVHD